MLSRPKFCCSCGERVERIEWHVWTSRKYCELCETEHRIDEWLPRAMAAAAVAIGVAGAGSLYSAKLNSPDIVNEPVRLAKERSARIAEVVVPSESPSAIPLESGGGQGPFANPAGDGAVPEKTETRIETEPVSFCGALTKKGTPCTRKVKGGGRCWQHRDRAPPETAEEPVRERAKGPDETS